MRKLKLYCYAESTYNNPDFIAEVNQHKVKESRVDVDFYSRCYSKAEFIRKLWALPNFDKSSKRWVKRRASAGNPRIAQKFIEPEDQRVWVALMSRDELIGYYFKPHNNAPWTWARLQNHLKMEPETFEPKSPPKTVQKPQDCKTSKKASALECVANYITPHSKILSALAEAKNNCNLTPLYQLGLVEGECCDCYYVPSEIEFGMKILALIPEVSLYLPSALTLSTMTSPVENKYISLSNPEHPMPNHNLKPLFTTAEEAQKRMEEYVAYLNRMLRQHKENQHAIVWLSMKEIIENTFLGYKVEWEL